MGAVGSKYRTLSYREHLGACSFCHKKKVDILHETAQKVFLFQSNHGSLASINGMWTPPKSGFKFLICSIQGLKSSIHTHSYYQLATWKIHHVGYFEILGNHPYVNLYELKQFCTPEN